MEFKFAEVYFCGLEYTYKPKWYELRTRVAKLWSKQYTTEYNTPNITRSIYT